MPHWIPIMDGAYEVSEHGDIKRVAQARGATVGRLLHHTDKDGYRVVSLSVGGLPRRYYVHRLVAAAFIGPCPDGQMVNHIDGNKANCSAINLEYCSYQENGRHAVGIGRVPSGERHGHAKLTERDVRTIRAKFAAGVKQAHLCKEFGVTAPTMHHIVHGITWKGI